VKDVTADVAVPVPAPAQSRRPAARGPLSDEEIRDEFRQARAEAQEQRGLTHNLAVGQTALQASVDTLGIRVATLPTREDFHAALSATPPEAQGELLRLQRAVLQLQKRQAQWALANGFLRGLAVPLLAYLALHWQAAGHWLAHVVAARPVPSGAGPAD